VASYVGRVLRGEYLVYTVDWPGNKATLGINLRKKSQYHRLDVQFLGQFNRPVTDPEVRECVKLFTEKVGDALTSDIISRPRVSARRDFIEWDRYE
jgi:hypothetical protein